MAKTLSLREQIMAALVDTFQARRQGVPTGLTTLGETAAFDFRWDSVSRYPLGDQEKQQENALAIIEGDETKNPQMGSVNAFLQVELNFRVFLEPRDEPAACLNNVLLNIQRTLRLDSTLGGLCRDVREDANSHEIQDFADRQVEGSVFATILYKHAESDPRLQRGAIT